METVATPLETVTDVESAFKGAIIDCDLHNALNSVRDLFPYLPMRWQAFLETIGAREYTGGFYPRHVVYREDARPPSGGMPGSDPAFVCSDHLDRYNVRYAVLNPLTAVGALPNQELDAALATAVNDWQVAEWLDADPRFRASALIPFDDSTAAVQEIRKRASDRRFVQVLFTGRPREPMGRRRYWPIYEACAETGLHIASHAFGAAGEPITGSGPASYYIEDHIGPPQAIQANITSLVVEGVFQRYPKLKLVSVENGFGWLPSLAWRLDSAWRLLSEEVPTLERSPSEYIRDHVFVSTQPVEEPPSPVHLKQLLSHYDAFSDRLLFSSDYPHWDADTPAAAVPTFMPDDVREKIFFRNAQQLYGLP